MLFSESVCISLSDASENETQSPAHIHHLHLSSWHVVKTLIAVIFQRNQNVLVRVEWIPFPGQSLTNVWRQAAQTQRSPSPSFTCAHVTTVWCLERLHLAQRLWSGQNKQRCIIRRLHSVLSECLPALSLSLSLASGRKFTSTLV